MTSAGRSNGDYVVDVGIPTLGRFSVSRRGGRIGPLADLLGLAAARAREWSGQRSDSRRAGAVSRGSPCPSRRHRRDRGSRRELDEPDSRRIRPVRRHPARRRSVAPLIPGATRRVSRAASELRLRLLGVQRGRRQRSRLRSIEGLRFRRGCSRPRPFCPACTRGSFIGPPTLLVRRSAYEAVGAQFAELIVLDWEMWLRLSAQFDVGFLEVWDADYRFHGGQTSANRAALAEHFLRVLDVSDDVAGACVAPPQGAHEAARGVCARRRRARRPEPRPSLSQHGAAHRHDAAPPAEDRGQGPGCAGGAGNGGARPTPPDEGADPALVVRRRRGVPAARAGPADRGAERDRPARGQRLMDLRRLVSVLRSFGQALVVAAVLGVAARLPVEPRPAQGVRERDPPARGSAPPEQQPEHQLGGRLEPPVDGVRDARHDAARARGRDREAGPGHDPGGAREADPRNGLDREPVRDDRGRGGHRRRRGGDRQCRRQAADRSLAHAVRWSPDRLVPAVAAHSDAGRHRVRGAGDRRTSRRSTSRRPPTRPASPCSRTASPTSVERTRPSWSICSTPRPTRCRSWSLRSRRPAASSPKPLVNAALAGMLAVLVVGALALAWDQLDDTVKSARTSRRCSATRRSR